MVDGLVLSMDSDSTSVLLLLDLSATFDTKDHSILKLIETTNWITVLLQQAKGERFHAMYVRTMDEQKTNIHCCLNSHNSQALNCLMVQCKTTAAEIWYQQIVLQIHVEHLAQKSDCYIKTDLFSPLKIEKHLSYCHNGLWSYPVCLCCCP